MAIVAFTAYSGKNECARVNGYIADGHGASSMTRINRYISDGHGGGTECLGHLCPSDPVLATAFMEAIHWNYDRQHSFNKARTKGRVDHVQLYVSPTEEDNVPSEERLQMTRELIERTALRDFPSIYIAHDNTDVGHCHISLCPFSMDGSHKLCMNNRLLYDLRREMDRICVEHGYSIIENPELWGDKVYRDWFMEVKAEGRITIHPPRDQSNTTKKEEKKRARDFVRSKQAKAKRREEQLQFYREIRVPDTPEKAQYFFTSPYLFHPANPEKPLQIKRIRPDGRERTELELRAAALGLWAHTCRTLLEERNVPGTESLTKRMQTIAGKSFEAMRLFVDLDIRSHEEMVQHIVCCGREIGFLRRKIKQQNETLQELQPAQNALEQWDYEKAEEARACLAALGYDTEEELEKLRSKHTQALIRKEKYIFRLEERNKEYRKLKTAEKTMDLLTCEDAWEGYLNGLFQQNRIQKTNQCSEEELEEKICQLGQMLGISDDTMDRYLNEAQEYAERLRNYEECRKSHREYWDRIFLARETEEKGYQQYEESMEFIQDLWNQRQKVAAFGALGLLLSILIEVWAEMRESMARFELELIMWEALGERLYAHWKKRKDDKQLACYSEVQRHLSKEELELSRHIQHMIWDMSKMKKEQESKSMKVLPEVASTFSLDR